MAEPDSTTDGPARPAHRSLRPQTPATWLAGAIARRAAEQVASRSLTSKEVPRNAERDEADFFTRACSGRHADALLHKRQPLPPCPPTTAPRPHRPRSGLTFVTYENPPGITTNQQRVQNFLDSDRAAWYRHVNITAHDHGGHFIPWELPDQWTDDLRRTLRPHRPSSG